MAVLTLVVPELRKYVARTRQHSVVDEAKHILRSKDPGVTAESKLWARRTLYRHGQLDVTALSDDERLLVTINN